MDINTKFLQSLEMKRFKRFPCLSDFELHRHFLLRIWECIAQFEKNGTATMFCSLKTFLVSYYAFHEGVLI